MPSILSKLSKQGQVLDGRRRLTGGTADASAEWPPWLILAPANRPSPKTSSTSTRCSAPTTTSRPIPSNPDQQVVFGTSGHRGSSLDTAFNENHIAATTQAIVEYRACQGITGPLYIGKDTHALSLPAWTTALEVLVANGVTVLRRGRRATTRRPRRCPARSWCTTRPRPAARRADGIVVTPSHNPPRDGGFKYNPPHGGPADSDATGLDRGPGERAARRHVRRDPAHPVRALRRRRRHPVRLPGRLLRGPGQRAQPARRSATPACTSAPTRWAAPASSTGATSPSTSAST